MIGPTGVGKTEIARRLAKLVNAPFVKVEASKFTEVGYVGRDVESIIRDLTEVAMNMVKLEHSGKVQEKAKQMAEERVLDILLPQPRYTREMDEAEEKTRYKETREKLRKQLREGALDDRYIEIDLKEKVIPFGIISNVAMEEIEINLKEMLGSFLPEKVKRKKVKISEALQLFTQEEANKLIDIEKVTKEAIERVEQTGIVFIDEIDKIASRGSSYGPDVSREGVQRTCFLLLKAQQ